MHMYIIILIISFILNWIMLRFSKIHAKDSTKVHGTNIKFHNKYYSNDITLKYVNMEILLSLNISYVNSYLVFKLVRSNKMNST